MKQKSLIVIIFLFVMIVVGVMNTSFYQEEINEFKNETLLSLTIDGVASETFPSKESGKTIESIECDNEAIASWDYESWGPVIKNLNQNRTKCQFHFVTKYHEENLNGTDPVLKEGLIPVTIDNDGTVYKANEKSEWYSYANQKWANAVILEDETKVYQNGETIPEDNIESYFVWIPKYRYKLWDLGNYPGVTSVDTNKVQTIDIVFGDYNTVDSKEGECKAPEVSGSSGNCSVGDYMTHPAFLSFGTKGIWVGKFETGYKGAINTKGAEKNINDTEKVEIKPNVYSWRNLDVSQAHLNSYNYKRGYDSHMMKNTEWGAVAYLQHSKYGSQKRVRINNNDYKITGYSAVNEPTCGYTGDNRGCNKKEGTDRDVNGSYTNKYNTEVGYLASTTGNITGIYDMAGGAWEYIMETMIIDNVLVSGDNNLYNTNFIGTFTIPGSRDSNASKTTWTAADGGISFPDKKYYDTYLYGNSYANKNAQEYTRRILGDATGEMGPCERRTNGNYINDFNSWHNNIARLMAQSGSSLFRGGTYSSGFEAGLFSFSNGVPFSFANSTYTNYSFRIVLAI